MEYRQIAKGLIDFQKMSFDSWFNAVSLMQDQAGSAVNLMLGQTTLIPADGQNAIKGWITVCQNERGRFKSYMQKCFSDMEKTILETADGATKKATKPDQG